MRFIWSPVTIYSIISRRESDSSSTCQGLHFFFFFFLTKCFLCLHHTRTEAQHWDKRIIDYWTWRNVKLQHKQQHKVSLICGVFFFRIFSNICLDNLVVIKQQHSNSGTERHEGRFSIYLFFIGCEWSTDLIRQHVTWFKTFETPQIVSWHPWIGPSIKPGPLLLYGASCVCFVHSTCVPPKGWSFTDSRFIVPQRRVDREENVARNMPLGSPAGVWFKNCSHPSCCSKCRLSTAGMRVHNV